MFDPLDKDGNPARYSLIEASTKAGKTVSAIAWLYEQALFLGEPNRNFWWVAPVSGQAKIAFRRLKAFLPAEEIANTNEQDMTIELPNGALIWFKSADKPDSLYGEDVWAAVIDEASRAKEEAWYAVRSTITATRAQCRMIGNVKGRRNWFYKMARKAEAGAPNMSYHRITAQDAVDAGVLDAEEIKGAKDELPAAVYKELYLAEASDDQGNPFGYDYIKAVIKPLSNRRPTQWGWDLAKSQDWTVGIALDDKGDVCRLMRFQKSWEETTNTIILETGMLPAFVDATGVGDPIVERLQKKGSNFVGYTFTSNSKQRLMEGLAVAIQRRETSVLEGVHQMEIEAFEYVYTRSGVQYSAPEGFHDDTVCAHALAVQAKAKGIDLGVWESLVRKRAA
jgi:phage FluMu gp28-like protein